MRRSACVPLQLLAAAALAAPQTDARAATNMRAPRHSAHLISEDAASVIARGGFGFNSDDWRTFLLVGASMVLLSLVSRGE